MELLPTAFLNFFLSYRSIQLAHAVDNNSYGLIFGFNTFLSLMLMTGLTFTVADEHGFDLDIRSQVSRGKL